MPFFDGIQTSYKLGDDLQVVDVTNIILWPTDEYDAGSGTSDQSPLISICEHQGSLFVAWCEAREDLSLPFERVVYGPFVKQYDPGSNTWIQVGDVEPTLFPVNQDDRATWNTIPAAFTLGTRFLPKLPRLVSDGTNLYCVYAIHESVAVSYPGHSTSFSPFKLTAKCWDGSAWVLWGEIPASGWNDHGPGAFGSNNSAFFGISAAASPHDVGACYITLVQSGETGGFGGGDPILYEGVVARFDGGAGTVKTIGTPRTDPSDPTGTTEFVQLQVRYDDADGPWIWWEGILDSGVDSISVYLQRWSDMAIIQTWPQLGIAPQINMPVGWEPGAWLNPVEVSFGPTVTALRELISDGSSSISDPLNGSTDLVYPPEDLSLDATFERPAFFKVFSEPPNDIWAVSYGPSGDYEGAVWLYHRPCEAWTRIPFTPIASDPFSGLPPAFWYLTFQMEGGRNLSLAHAPEATPAAMDNILFEGVIYVAAFVTNLETGRTIIRVYAAPIQRNKFNCASRGVYLAPYYLPLGNEASKIE